MNNYRTPLLEKAGKIYLKTFIVFSIIYWIYVFFDDYSFLFNKDTKWSNLLGVWFMYFIFFSIYFSICYWTLAFIFLVIFKLYKKIFSIHQKKQK
jgi:hypothetical protein